MTDKHRAVKLRIARKRGDLLAVAVMEGRLPTVFWRDPNGAEKTVPTSEGELRALWGDR